MVDSNAFHTSIKYNRNFELQEELLSPNPLRMKNDNSKLCNSSDYSQVILKSKVDKDAAEILKKIRDLLKISPSKLVVPYSYIVEEINGERIYDDNGQLLLIREYENETIKDYFPDTQSKFINKIIETNKNNNKIISKIEPNFNKDGTISSKIIIFDETINNKYTMYQVEENGIIKTITEFLEESKNFRSLFKNTNTLMPERYIETRKNNNGEFEMLDCKLTPDLSEIRYTTDKKQTIIQYRDNYKYIDVKKVSTEATNQ